jgi:hypothetical protein
LLLLIIGMRKGLSIITDVMSGGRFSAALLLGSVAVVAAIIAT